MFKKMALICLFTVMSFAHANQLLDKVVAVVNNGVITSSELEKQVQSSKKQIAAQNIQMPEDKVLRKQVLQHLIDVNIQMQMAKQNGIHINKEELNAAIERIASMNHITLAQLQEEIGKEGMSWKEYQKNIRKEMLINQLQQKSVGKDVIVSNEQVEQYLKTNKTVDPTKLTYRLQNIVILLNEEPTPEQLKKAKAKAESLLVKIRKGGDFSRIAIEESSGELALEGGDLGDRHLPELPEIFAKEVVKMQPGQVVGPLRTGNGFQLIKLVSVGGTKEHHIITQTHVRHILLKLDASMLPSESDKLLDNMYQQVKSGKNFESMAKKHSLDVNSAGRGGDLGWVVPGELVPEFENAMNTLPLNKVSKPVKSQFGWHLIQVLGRRQKDDSDAYKKQQVRQFLQQRKFAEAVQSWQQHLRTEAYVNIVDKDLA